MNYDEMSIPQLEAEISRIEEVVSANRKEQAAVHGVMERKLKLIPIVPTANDQGILMGGDIISQLKALPPSLFEQAKSFFKGEN